MSTLNLQELQYPIGKFEVPDLITQRQIGTWINSLDTLPRRLADLVNPLSENQLETPYRPNGWTVRQVVHHLADSHHNSYIRFKWALTEREPTIKPYDEKAWANLFDTREGPIALSLLHLKAVHQKLVYLLRGLSSGQLERTFVHPEGNEISTLKVNIGRYAWHGDHHFAHIDQLISREGW